MDFYIEKYQENDNMVSFLGRESHKDSYKI
jgi:hypothetical protein